MEEDHLLITNFAAQWERSDKTKSKAEKLAFRNNVRVHFARFAHPMRGPVEWRTLSDSPYYER